MEDNIRKIILKEDYDTSNWKYWYIITYDTTKTDIIDIENVIEVAREKEDYTIDDILERLNTLEGIIDMESLDLYEVYY